jgi:hypothetical protein
MRKTARRERLIVTTLTLVVAGCFAAMIALSLGGCAEESEDPVPQENSDSDLIPDPDLGGTARIAPASEDGELDPNPVADLRSTSDFTASLTGSHYDRTRALDYIRRYALNPNPQTAYCSAFDRESLSWNHEDCTNFASQVLWYGGLSMAYTGSAYSGWWYTNSCTDAGSSRGWRQVNGLVSYLISESHRGEFYQRARDLKIGDLIFYRLRRPETGYRCDVSNLFNHTTVVSGFDANGEPLVSYHSNERFGAPWNANNHSGQSLGEACAVGFVHIKD